MPTSVHDVADYIIVKLDDARVGLNTLKLHKLLYYVQAWRLALKGEPLFSGKFQAWVHGPVSRQIYDRFSSSHGMYDLLRTADATPGFDVLKLDTDVRSHVDEILDAYAAFSGPQLEQMTHEEPPWIVARGDRKPSERCEVELHEDLMRDFFKDELRRSEAA